jgi:bacteriorhodopsin
MSVPDNNEFEYAMTLVNIVMFLLLTMYGVLYVTETPAKVQNMPLKTRVRYCIGWNIYVCAISCVMNGVSLTTRLDDGVMAWFGRYIHIARPLEWLLTCPLMMLEVVVVAGPLVQSKRRVEIVGITVAILILGFFATVAQRTGTRASLFVCGAVGFCALATKMDQVVYEHTGTETRLFTTKTDKDGNSPALKKVLIKVLATWVVFPIWWFLSPDGFSIVEDHDVHQGVFLLLNIISKAVFCYCIFALDGVPEPKYVARYADTVSSPTFKYRYSMNNGNSESKSEVTSDTALPASKREQLLEERMAKLDDLFEHFRHNMALDKINKKKEGGSEGTVPSAADVEQATAEAAKAAVEAREKRISERQHQLDMMERQLRQVVLQKSAEPSSLLAPCYCAPTTNGELDGTAVNIMSFPANGSSAPSSPFANLEGLPHERYDASSV